MIAALLAFDQCQRVRSLAATHEERAEARRQYTDMCNVFSIGREAAAAPIEPGFAIAIAGNAQPREHHVRVHLVSGAARRAILISEHRDIQRLPVVGWPCPGIEVVLQQIQLIGRDTFARRAVRWASEHVVKQAACRIAGFDGSVRRAAQIGDTRIGPVDLQRPGEFARSVCRVKVEAVTREARFPDGGDAIQQIAYKINEHRRPLRGVAIRALLAACGALTASSLV
jgi:hypothetical protein